MPHEKCLHVYLTEYQCMTFPLKVTTLYLGKKRRIWRKSFKPVASLAVCSFSSTWQKQHTDQAEFLFNIKSGIFRKTVADFMPLEQDSSIFDKAWKLVNLSLAEI